jgi:hypothetical protein
MNAHRYLTGMMAVLLFGSCIANAQDKKPAAPKPAAKAAAPAKAPAASKAASPSAAKGPSTGGAASHGPTTAGSASHGPTTAGAAKGPTTAGAAKGPTTGGAAKGGPSTGGAAKGGPGTAGAQHTANTPTHSGGPGTGNPAGGNRPGGGSAAKGSPAGGGRTGPGGRPATGSHVASASNGSSVRTRANGSRADIHDSKRGMDVHHGLNGNRRVSAERADHSRVVSSRGGRGYYQQRPYRYGGHEYARRTYYDHGRAYDRYYNRYPYHGIYLEGYAPSVYYAPAFYGWAYNPWVAPVPYAWGFVATPWYGYYGAYFTPYPVYPSASVWLADYIISQSLAANFAAQQAIAAQSAMAPDASPMTPQIKDMIAEEVKRQIALENQEATVTASNSAPDPASSGIARMLSDNVQHVFVAGSDLDVIDAGGTECAVSEGDALQLSGPPAEDATAADLVVLSSKGGKECKKGATVSVALTDLQDMQNHMRETIDAGMTDLQDKGGKGGLPAVPASAKAAPVKAGFTAIAPPPDANAAAEVDKVAKEADTAETEVASQVAGGQAVGDSGPSAAAAAPAAPAEISLGQTIDQVIGILGQPKTISDLGSKKIYVYKDMKVVFVGGKVSDVQ